MIYRSVRSPLAEGWRILILSTYTAPGLIDKIFGGGLDQFLTKEIKASLPEGPFSFAPGDWGSCQYDSASLIYDMWFEARKSLRFEEALYAFGVTRMYVNYWGIRGAIKYLVEYLEGEIEEYRELGEEENVRVNQEALSKVKGAINYDTLFEACRATSWDLWAVVEEILPHSLNIKFESIPKPGAMPSYIPIYNAIIQEELNYPTGLKCALAREFGLVTDEESFVDFDT